MTSRNSSGFREVSISLHSDSQLPLKEDPSSASFPQEITRLGKSSLSSNAASKTHLQNISSKMAMTFRIRPGQTVPAFQKYSSETSSLADDSENHPSDGENGKKKSRGPLARLRMFRNALIVLSRPPKSPAKEKKVRQPLTRSDIRKKKEADAANMNTKIEGWSAKCTRAIQMDLNGDTTGAYDAYCSFNRQITKEAILHFEQLTGDQQKLLNWLLQVMDKRIKILKRALALHRSPTVSAATTDSGSEDTTLQDLQDCLHIFGTLRTINSRRRMPVVLVYRERYHRTHHKDQRKGKSNKIIYAREKRELLQLMGLPGKMITEGGLDFSIQPEVDATDEEKPNLVEGDEETGSLQITSDIKRSDDGEVVDSMLDSEDERSISRARSETVLPVASRYLRAQNKISRSPRHSVKGNLSPRHAIKGNLSPRHAIKGNLSPRHAIKGNLNNEEKQYSSTDTLSDGELSEDNFSDEPENKSMLSCDTCSSTESINSDFEEESHTDIAVLGNYTHQELIKDPPFYQEENTYITLAFDKVGLKNCHRLFSTFLRISIRDPKGVLLAEEQETSTWDVINRHRLRAPGSVFIQESLENLPESAAIFFEVRHFIKEKRKLSTLCYTFLEKSDIENGEFICEMYNPPVQFSRDNLVPYSNKAFFLHLEIKIENLPETECSESLDNSEFSEARENSDSLLEYTDTVQDQDQDYELNMDKPSFLGSVVTVQTS